MNKTVFDAIRGIYTLGDLQGIRSHLLHSSAWHQGQFTAYGESQHSRLWINWLTHCGVSDINKVCQVDGGAGQSALLLEMKPAKSACTVRSMFFLEHNDTHIKNLNKTVDTSMLVRGLGSGDEAFSQWWPEPDPLIISDYDQQLHPQTYHATPTDILGKDSPYLMLLEKWWDIWQKMQLSNVWHLYSEQSEIKLPGCTENKSNEGLFEFISGLLNQLSRHYCQLESVIQDTSSINQLAIKWYLEGDLNTDGGVKRVRLPFMTLLEINNDTICTEYMLFDQVAFNKQFPSVKLRIC